MKTSRLLRNTKALSPVIATIILVAVTVAIAIAVAAWLGALTFTYTRTEQITITSLSFANSTAAIVSLVNSGTSDVTLTTARAQGAGISGSATSTAFRCGNTLCNAAALVPRGGTLTLTINWVSGVSWQAGARYDITLISSQGNPFPTSAIR